MKPPLVAAAVLLAACAVPPPQTGGSTGAGYGCYWFEGRNRLAHRAAYIIAFGEIPAGLVIDHYRFPDKCVGPACVHPEHLRPVTVRENNLRSSCLSSLNRAKTHCLRGHEYSPENTYTVYGGRRCKACRNDKNRAKYVPKALRGVA